MKKDQNKTQPNEDNLGIVLLNYVKSRSSTLYKEYELVMTGESQLDEIMQQYVVKTVEFMLEDGKRTLRNEEL